MFCRNSSCSNAFLCSVVCHSPAHNVAILIRREKTPHRVRCSIHHIFVSTRKIQVWPLHFSGIFSHGIWSLLMWQRPALLVRALVPISCLFHVETHSYRRSGSVPWVCEFDFVHLVRIHVVRYVMHRFVCDVYPQSVCACSADFVQTPSILISSGLIVHAAALS